MQLLSFRFYQHYCRTSAREIVPYLLKSINPKSVVDVGCSNGTWLSVFHENGIDDFFGMDSFANPRLLEIPRHKFFQCDLRKPVKLKRKFDIVISLEVAEHLDEQFAADFVNYLTRLGDVVMFSAAIPRQEGAGHVNLQWPEYWAGLFEKNGYVAVDCIRKEFWQNPNVYFWYAQNIILYVREDCLNQNPVLKKEFEKTNRNQLSLIHPTMYIINKTELKKWKSQLFRKLFDKIKFRTLEICYKIPGLYRKIFDKEMKRGKNIYLAKYKDRL